MSMPRIGSIVTYYIVNSTKKQNIRIKLIRKMSTAGRTENEKPIIAVGQMRTTNDKAANMRQVEELVARAETSNATFLFLPECCDFVGEHRQQTLELSETLRGSTVKRYKELAKCNKMWLSLGGLHESVLDTSEKKTEKIYNAHVVINAEGELVSVYRKLHLFDVETPTVRFRESDVVMPGTSLVPPVATPIGRLGLQICYDMRFAETSLLLRKLGAEILTYPSAFTYTTGQAHWELLLRARAIENQCYVIAAAQQGSHNAKRQSWGHAMIISPWGKVLADCGGDQELALATAEINLNVLHSVRSSMPCFKHRRNDIYSLTPYDVFEGKECIENRCFANNIIDHRTIFYESEHCFAFTNLRCVVKGHVLVSTKRVTPRLNGLTCTEMSDLFTTVCRIQRMLEDIYGTTSATVTVQDGAEAGQTVPHVHFHVMPRRPGDFGHNDQIYVKLDRIDAEDKPPRSIQERIEEAEQYRQFLYSNKIVPLLDVSNNHS